jgi:hypothetical protein
MNFSIIFFSSLFVVLRLGGMPCPTWWGEPSPASRIFSHRTREGEVVCTFKEGRSLVLGRKPPSPRETPPPYGAPHQPPTTSDLEERGDYTHASRGWSMRMTMFRLQGDMDKPSGTLKSRQGHSWHFRCYNDGRSKRVREPRSGEFHAEADIEVCADDLQ